LRPTPQVVGGGRREVLLTKGELKGNVGAFKWGGPMAENRTAKAAYISEKET